jgi:outer membrane protein W
MTKKICVLLLFACLAFSATNAQDQEFKKFRVGLGGGYAVPGGKGAKGGILLYLEPGYRITDQILVAARFEFAAMLRGYEQDVNTGSASASFSGSNSLFGQYFLMNENFRPFVGLGVGMFNVSTISVTADNSGSADVYEGIDETKIGVIPRIGFDFRHFTLSLDFNLVGSSTVKSSNSANELTTKNGYVGIRFGGFFGGGRKD